MRRRTCRSAESHTVYLPSEPVDRAALVALFVENAQTSIPSIAIGGRRIRDLAGDPPADCRASRRSLGRFFCGNRNQFRFKGRGPAFVVLGDVVEFAFEGNREFNFVLAARQARDRVFAARFGGRALFDEIPTQAAFETFAGRFGWGFAFLACADFDPLDRGFHHRARRHRPGDLPFSAAASALGAKRARARRGQAPQGAL